MGVLAGMNILSLCTRLKRAHHIVCDAWSDIAGL